MFSSSHGGIEKYEDMRTEARRLYNDYQPFPWWGPVERKGPFVLSMIVCGILAVAMLNGAFLKERFAEQVLWISFGVWTALFFAYLVAKVVFARKKAKLFRRRHPYHHTWL